MIEHLINNNKMIVKQMFVNASPMTLKRVPSFAIFKCTNNHVQFNRYISSKAGRSSTQSIYFADSIDPNESKFKKILIANRGEIACRVIKTCKLMGIKTVAIHSDVDSMSLHTLSATESRCIGPAPSKSSYLNMDAIIKVIQETGADAVHPGYGFLSENTDFAKRLTDIGVTFIGPNSESIHAMGDKIESKKIAKTAGVHIIPGYDGIVKGPEHCVALAKEIGYPVMIKASAGGGGKGMRIAWNDHDAIEGYRFSSQEAASSFGDDRLLIEKYINDGRHIEIQVLCDKHGNAIHLNERECSIQRRNQKVIEEAPSTFVDPEMRQKMGQQAVDLALAVGYDSAGTCEFLVDSQRNFYFLEMNTRLQVEHPITEFITGIDLVHQMIRIAKGHKLKYKQSDVMLKGWAIESRVYAEDPYKSFGLPSIGRLTKYKEPLNIPNVRCDSGVREGSEISIYYDPLICKLATYGDTRNDALSTMTKALDTYVIRGVTHNIPLLRDVMTEDNFVKGNMNTKYLYETYADGFKGKQLTEEQYEYLSAFAAAIYVRDNERASTLLNSVSTDSLKSKNITEWELTIDIGNGTNRWPISLKIIDDTYIINVNGSSIELPKNIALSSPTLKFNINGDEHITQIISLDGTGKMKIQFQGTIFDIFVLTKIAAEYQQLMPAKPKLDVSKFVKAPMPGLMKSLACKIGDSLSEGQEVCVIEAMKMQNSLTVSAPGIVKAINCNAGDTVDEDQILVELE